MEFLVVELIGKRIRLTNFLPTDYLTEDDIYTVNTLKYPRSTYTIDRNTRPVL